MAGQLDDFYISTVVHGIPVVWDYGAFNRIFSFIAVFIDRTTRGFGEPNPNNFS